MKALSLDPVKPLYNSKFCLFGIAVGLAALHLNLIWRVIGDVDRLIIGALFWGALLYLLRRKQNFLDLDSGIFSSFFGLLLIALVVLKSTSLFWFETDFLKLAPLVAALGLGLLASGVKGLKQYWRELLIVALLCLPESSLTYAIDGLLKITTLTTQFAVFILWYLGFEVTRQGLSIILPNGSVWVGADCTGISSTLLLLKLWVLFILVFPVGWTKRVLISIAAVWIPFVGGGFRVALMAGVVSNQAAFDYWHGPEGNQIFSTVSILLFGLFCHFLLQSRKFASAEMELQ